MTNEKFKVGPTTEPGRTMHGLEDPVIKKHNKT